MKKSFIKLLFVVGGFIIFFLAARLPSFESRYFVCFFLGEVWSNLIFLHKK